MDKMKDKDIELLDNLAGKGLKVGHVYWLHNFTAPKIFNGLNFECLVTDQLISHQAKVNSCQGHLKSWKGEIYKPERFEVLLGKKKPKPPKTPQPKIIKY